MQCVILLQMCGQCLHRGFGIKYVYIVYIHIVYKCICPSTWDSAQVTQVTQVILHKDSTHRSLCKRIYPLILTDRA